MSTVTGLRICAKRLTSEVGRRSDFPTGRSRGRFVNEFASAKQYDNQSTVAKALDLLAAILTWIEHPFLPASDSHDQVDGLMPVKRASLLTNTLADRPREC